MSDTHKVPAAKPVVWSGLEIGLRQSMQLIVLLVLARLLTPEQFGTVAVLTAITALGTVISEAGMTTALIQAPSISNDDRSTVFWTCSATGAVCATIILGTASAVTTTFDLPDGRALLSTMSVSVVISALGATPMALFARDLRFRRIMLINTSSVSIAGATAVVFAASGAGAWSLVAQSTVAPSVVCLLAWLNSSWRPSLLVSPNSFRQLSTFGGYVLVANILEAVFQRLYAFVLGLTAGPASVGYYARADSTQAIPSTLVASIVTRVALPVFARMADNSPELGPKLRRAMQSLLWVSAPVMVMLGATAALVVEAVFGRQWSPAAPVLSLLSIAGLLLPIHALNLNVLLARGFAKLALRLEFAKKAVAIPMVALGSLFGIRGVAIAYVTFSVVALGINTYFSARLWQYPLITQLRDLLEPLALCLLPATFAVVLVRFWEGPALVVLLVTTFGFVSIYLIQSFLFRPVGYLESTAVLASVLRSRRGAAETHEV